MDSEEFSFRRTVPSTGPDKDGFLGDPDTDKIIRDAAQYFPALAYDKNSVRESFKTAINAESDPKIKGLLQLLEALYLNRKQYANELNEVFRRTAILANTLHRCERNVFSSGENINVLYENEKLIEAALNSIYKDTEKESKRTKNALTNLAKFKKEYEPSLRRLKQYINESAAKFKHGAR